MARITRLLSIVVCSFLSAMAFVGDLLAEVARADMPPLLDPRGSSHADQLLRTSKAEMADTSPSGAMFSERVRDHERFIGDGFTNLGHSALPI